jgi:serine/threonine-protein kinase SRPK3
MPANLSRLHIPCPTRLTGRGEVCRGPDNKPSGFPGQTYEHTYEIYAEGEADNIHLYKPGGLHPVIVGDVLNNGRYHLVHKLGAGDASTVWLARGLHHQGGSQPNDPLVSIKILQASEKSTTSVAPNELSVARALQSSAADRGRKDVASQLLSIRSMFTEEGPNGSHVCLVSPVAGPSLDWGEWYSLRRFRPDVGRKICKQVTEAVQHMHSSGYVHGGEWYEALFSIGLDTEIDLSN